MRTSISACREKPSWKGKNNCTEYIKILFQTRAICCTISSYHQEALRKLDRWLDLADLAESVRLGRPHGPMAP